jgi:hypothetical protein
MILRIAVVALLAGVATAGLASTAEAGHRWSFFRFFQPSPETYYPDAYDRYGPDYIDPGTGDDDYDTYDPRYDPRYRDQQGYYDPVYNDPGDPPLRPKKPLNRAPVKKPVAAAPKKPTPKAAAITCNKAGSIVSSYGFTSVKPASCSGKVYAFNAQRSGKPYVVKLSSATGELTEVKKQ